MSLISTATAAATSTVMLPSSPESGVTTRVYWVALTAAKVPLVPLETLMSAAVKSVTASEKVRV